MQLVQYNNQQPVLFISGMFAGSWTWSKSHEQIIGSHTLINEPLMGISNNVEDLVDTISKQVRDLPMPVAIVGNSLGGYVALAIAKQVPEKVEQVLISGSAGFSKMHLDIKDCLSREKAPKLGRRLADIICYDKSKAMSEDLDRLVLDLQTHLRNMLGLFKSCNRIEASDILPHVQCPVRALWGREDVISPFSDACPILEKYGVEYELIDKSGHSPMYEHPAEFAEWVNRCLLDIRQLRHAA